PFTEKLVVIGQLGESLVESHDVASQLQAARAERRLQETKCGAALRFRQVPEADALAHIEMLIHPLAPFRVVDREHCPVALVFGEAREETLCGGADGRG